MAIVRNIWARGEAVRRSVRLEVVGCFFGIFGWGDGTSVGKKLDFGTIHLFLALFLRREGNERCPILTPFFVTPSG